MAIIAGAGAGKTRVLTRRIAFRALTGAHDPAHVLAVTFTRKAAGELQSRLRSLGVEGVTAGTIHSVALAQLARRARELARAEPVVLSRKARVLVPLMGARGAAAVVAAREVAEEIEWAKARMISPEGYSAAATLAGRSTSRSADEVGELYARYEREKKRKRVVDFDDLMWGCADALERDTEFAASQHWRFRHVFVDEFQDVTPAQARVLRGWVGDRSDLCVVGDPDQAIYAFAGADAAHLTQFSRHFGGGHVLRLDRNYRSAPPIVAAAEALLADAGRPRPARHAVRSDGPPPTVTAYDTDDAEADGVAAALRAAHGPHVPWSSLAVLYRINAQSAGFEQALTKAGIPFRVRGDSRFLERPEVVSALKRLREAAATAPTRSFREHVVDLEADAAEEQREHVEALARLAHEYLEVEAGPGAVPGFLAYLTTTLQGEAPATSGDAVDLLTFHRAKGLEFHTVFVTGLERGLVPIAHAESPADRAEERRLLYVAITRAEHTVHLSYAKERTFGTRASRRQRSPWLAPIEATLRTAEPPRASSGTAGPAQAKAKLAVSIPPPEHDVALFDALVEWRRNLARASGVPAFVIFHDTTLKAVAAARPSTRDALLAVPGIGPVKIERHADAVLDLVRRHAS